MSGSKRNTSTRAAPGPTEAVGNGCGAVDPSGFRVARLETVYSTELLEPLSLAEVRDIARGTSKKAATIKMREFYARGGKTDPEYDRIKRTELLVIMPAITAERGTARSDISGGGGLTQLGAKSLNGFYGYDLDGDHENLNWQALRQDAINTPGAAIVGTSSNGHAGYALFLGPVAHSNDEYNLIRDAIIDQCFPASLQHHNEGSRDAVKLRIIPYDPDIWAASSVTPLTVALPKWKPPTGYRAPTRTPGSAGHEQRTADGWAERFPELRDMGDQLEGPCPNCGGDTRFKVPKSGPYEGVGWCWVGQHQCDRGIMQAYHERGQALGFESGFHQDNSRSTANSEAPPDVRSPENDADGPPAERGLLFVQDGEARPVILTDQQSYAELIGQALPNYGVAYYTGDLAAVDLNPLNDRPITVWHGQGADYAAACAKAVLRHTEDVRIVPWSVGDKDGIPELNYEAIIRWVEQRAAPAPLALRPLRAVTWASIGAAPPREWLVREWVPVGCVTLLTGRGGSGKSRLALQLSAGVAAGGGLWMPGTTAPAIAQVGPVLYASWEDDKFEYARRMAEISSSSANPWVTPDRLGDLHFADMAGHGPTWGPVGGKHISTVAQLLDAGQALRELATAVNPALVVIDPLAAAWRGNENDRSLVRDFMSNWDFWARETRTAVLIVAHPSKNPASNFSGSTDWEAAARSAINLANEKVGPAPQGRNAEDYRREAWQLSNSKANYGPQAHPLELKFTARGDADDDAAETRWECAGPWETRSEPTTTAGNGHGDDIDW